MQIDAFSTSLFDEMEKKLIEIEETEKDSLQIARDSSAMILKYISRLKTSFTNYEFATPTEEINFFKNLKPRFIGKLIFYQKKLKIQSRVPISTVNEIKSYYVSELKKIDDFFKDNNDFYVYHRSASTSLDQIYFLRKEPDSWLLLNFEDYETDLSFTTIYDHKLSKILAFESLSEFLKSSIDKLETKLPEVKNLSSVNKHQITWTGSKVSLVELLYALQSTGSFNKGQIDLKQLANHLEQFFNIDLGNYYRIFQEIRIRKINRTSFIDQLKQRLIQRMDDADENPKFK